MKDWKKHIVVICFLLFIMASYETKHLMNKLRGKSAGCTDLDLLLTGHYPACTKGFQTGLQGLSLKGGKIRTDEF